MHTILDHSEFYHLLHYRRFLTHSPVDFVIGALIIMHEPRAIFFGNSQVCETESIPEHKDKTSNMGS